MIPFEHQVGGVYLRGNKDEVREVLTFNRYTMPTTTEVLDHLQGTAQVLMRGTAFFPRDDSHVSLITTLLGVPTESLQGFAENPLYRRVLEDLLLETPTGEQILGVTFSLLPPHYWAEEEEGFIALLSQPFMRESGAGPMIAGGKVLGNGAPLTMDVPGGMEKYAVIVPEISTLIDTLTPDQIEQFRDVTDQVHFQKLNYLVMGLLAEYFDQA